MKKLRYIIILQVLIFCLNSPIHANSTQLDKIISKNSLSKTTIVSVSMREVHSGKLIYEKHADLLLHPASTLKAFTTPVILDRLGAGYKVKTSLYRLDDEFFLKLRGDPLLTSEELVALFAGTKINSTLTIDDSAIDNIQWGVGWMWDDKTNPHMPKFSAYNLDNNLIKKEKNWIPVENPEEYFLSKLCFKGEIKKGKVPKKAVLINEITHNLIEEITEINKNSNNLAAETLFKLAADGTTKGGLKAFKKFYKKLGANASEQLIVDASGVSHNNLISTNWMTLALCKLYYHDNFGIYVNSLKTKRNVWYKTGTNAGISGRTGYLKSDSGKLYAFAILIQNYKGKSAPAKRLEDQLIDAMIKF